jgi:hypothetical protein
MLCATENRDDALRIGGLLRCNATRRGCRLWVNNGRETEALRASRVHPIAVGIAAVPGSSDWCGRRVASGLSLLARRLRRMSAAIGHV